MGSISLQIPQIGLADTTEDVKVANNFTTIQTAINGNLDATNLTAGVAQSATVNQSGQTVKGSALVTGGQSTSSTTFTTLSTPDQVAGLVLPAAGVLVVLYRALWSTTVVSGGNQAAIFIGANQLVQDIGLAVPAVQAASGPNTANTAVGLASSPSGLVGSGSSTAVSVEATTGQTFSTQGVGGACFIYAAAGTYTVSVQFKAGSGSISASNRRLYVQAVSFT